MEKTAPTSGTDYKQREEYHTLYRAYYRPLVMYALGFTGERTEAEDAVQDVFAALWERRGERPAPEKSCHTYLYNAVRNTCLNLLKRRDVQGRYEAYALAHAGEEESEEERVMREELYERLFRAVDGLPPRCREIFLMHLDGKKNEEIAAALQLSLLTVKTQKKKALHHLRERLGTVALGILGIL